MKWLVQNEWKMNGFVSIDADERDILSKAAILFQFTVQIWYLGCLWELSIRFMKWRTRMNVSAFYFLFYSSKLFATQGRWCISLDGYLVSKSQYLTIKVCTMPTADWLTGNGSRQVFFAHRLYIKDCPSSGSEKGRRCRNVLNLQPGC